MAVAIFSFVCSAGGRYREDSTAKRAATKNETQRKGEEENAAEEQVDHQKKPEQVRAAEGEEDEEEDEEKEEKETQRTRIPIIKTACPNGALREALTATLKTVPTRSDKILKRYRNVTATATANQRPGWTWSLT